MAGYVCPFCSVASFENDQNFKLIGAYFIAPSMASTGVGKIDLIYHKCPSCYKMSVSLSSQSSDLRGLSYSYPEKSFKRFPIYIPEIIRKDYEEACLILELSPKASATLSRRCLQGMIRDFWGITGRKNLKQEIDAIQNMVHPEQWKVVHAVRQLGNIGAHMEEDVNLIVDIDPGEAEKLIKLIELLMHDWYIRRYEQQQLYSDILEINDSKQEQRSKE